MNNKFEIKNILSLLICFISTVGLAYSQVTDSISKNDSIFTQKILPLKYYKNFGPPYYPEVKLTEEDSLSWPIIYDLSVDFIDIKDLDVKNNFFSAKLVFNTYSKYGFKYVTESGDELPMRHSDWIALYLKESDKRFLGSLIELDRDGSYVSYNKASDSEPSDIQTGLKNEPSLYGNMFSKTSISIENEFDHKWNLGSYPFDTQKLIFEFQTQLDTSLVAIKPSKKFVSTFRRNMRNLTAGYQITDVTYRNDYITTDSDMNLISPNFSRATVTQSLLVELNVRRSGTVLFFKIFTGGILSFFISCMVFLIPLKELESRVNLAVGGIFGAIGSSAFVYDVLPVVNVFTKADAINNLIIFMVVFNILVLLLQQTTFRRFNEDGKYYYKTVEVQYFRRLQNSNYSFFFSIMIFCSALLVILVW
tara:strand:- start:676 stop:1935 length:1260 start_codon:yes stop_codon:yes gene_type:complete